MIPPFMWTGSKILPSHSTSVEQPVIRKKQYFLEYKNIPILSKIRNFLIVASRMD